MKVLIILSTLILTTLSKEVARDRRETDKEYPLELVRVVHFASVIKMDPSKQKLTPPCAAVVLSEIWLTGSASCLSDNKGTLKIQTAVEMFYVTVKNNPNLYSVKNVTAYPQYKKEDTVSLHDICLIEVNEKIKIVIGKVYAAPLPKAGCIPKAGEEILATKFGFVSTTQRTALVKPVVPLKLVTVIAKVIDLKACGDALPKESKVTNIFCAKTDKCSMTLNLLGEPATQDGHLMGLLVKSPCSGDTNTSSVYLSVAPYVKWIVDTTNIDNVQPFCPRAGMVKG